MAHVLKRNNVPFSDAIQRVTADKQPPSQYLLNLEPPSMKVQPFEEEEDKESFKKPIDVMETVDDFDRYNKHSMPDHVASTRLLEERYDKIRSDYLRNKDQRKVVRRRDASEQASDEDFANAGQKKIVDEEHQRFIHSDDELKEPPVLLSSQCGLAVHEIPSQLKTPEKKDN